MLQPHRDSLPALVVAAFTLVFVRSNDGLARPLGPAEDPGLQSAVEELVVLVNEHRRSVGCPELRWNPEVAAVAQAHSKDMVERDFFSHINPDRESPTDRLTAAGVQWTRSAENIAWGEMTPQAVLDGWLISSGHRQNIESCELLEHGVGLEDGRWTHVFVTP